MKLSVGSFAMKCDSCVVTRSIIDITEVSIHRIKHTKFKYQKNHPANGGIFDENIRFSFFPGQNTNYNSMFTCSVPLCLLCVLLLKCDKSNKGVHSAKPISIKDYVAHKRILPIFSEKIMARIFQFGVKLYR